MQLHHTLLLHLHEGQRLIDQAGSILVAGCQNRLAAVRAHGVAGRAATFCNLGGSDL